MKKLILIVGVLLMAHASYSQIFSWGLKGGVNSSKISFDDFSIDQPPTVSVDQTKIGEPDFFMDVNGTTIINPSYISITAPKVSFNPSSYDMGYHFGAFARVKLLGIFIQPELIFSQTNTTINVVEGDVSLSDFKESAANIKYTNFDIPLMVGVKLGPLRLNAGPVASFKLGNNPEETASAEVNQMLNDFTAVTQKATFGGQAGVGLDILGKVTLDVRYEFPLSKLGDNITIGDYSYSTDQRASQFLASIGIMF